MRVRRVLRISACMALPLLLGVVAPGLCPARAVAALPQPGEVVQASIDASGSWFNSQDPSISADGRYVVFSAWAHFDWDASGASHYQVYVKDMDTGATRLVSNQSGMGGNGDSQSPSISADGRRVAFLSVATDLVPGDTNGTTDVFVKDLDTGTTVRVSTDSSGGQGDRGSGYPSISADGRHVAFWSEATDLVPGDTNGFNDWFVKDLDTGTTVRVSTDSSGAQCNADDWGFPSISADGRYVAFGSRASNLVPGDTNGTTDVFVKDLETGVTRLVSSNSHGAQGDQNSSDPSISADGRHVAFWSMASNFVLGDTPDRAIFVKDLDTGEVRLASRRSGNLSFLKPCISPNGRSVVFGSQDLDLAPRGDRIERIFVADLETGSMSLVGTNSPDAFGNVPYGYSISADGRYVAFLKDATVFVKNTLAPGSGLAPYEPVTAPAATQWARPTIVLIGGLWGDFPGGDSASGWQPANTHMWHDTYDTLRDAGYRVIVVPMQNGGSVPNDVLDGKGGYLYDNTSHLYNYLRERGLSSNQHVVLVGHSMGGLIARCYSVFSKGAWSAGPRVDGIYQLDTPNLGSPVAALSNLAQGKAFSSPSIYQLDSLGSTIDFFNDTLADKHQTVPIRRSAGNFFPAIASQAKMNALQRPVFGALCDWFAGADNDGAVSVQSAQWMWPGSDAGSYWMPLIHSSGNGLGLWTSPETAYPSRGTVWERQLLNDLRGFIAKVSANDAPPSHPAPARTVPLAGVTRAAVQPFGAPQSSALDTASGWTTNRDGQLALSADTTTLVPFSVEGTGALVTVFAESGTPVLSIATSLGAPVACETTTSSGQTAGVFSCAPGEYVAQVSLSGTDAAVASFSVLDCGSTELRVSAPPQVAAGASFDVLAGVYEGGVRRTGGAFTASVGAGAPVALHDDGVAPDTIAGDGVFASTLTAPATGIADATVCAEGVDAEGLAFARVAHALVSVAVPRASLTGDYAWRTTSGTSGKADALLFDIGVHASQDCTLEVGGTVTSGGDGIAQPSTLATLSAGTDTTVTLALTPDELERFDVAGDFSLSSIALYDMTDGALVRLDSAAPSLAGTLAPKDVEYAHCSLALRGSAPTSATTIVLSGEAVCTTETIGGVELSFDGGTTWYQAPPPSAAWGSNDATWSCAFTLPEGDFGAISEALDAGGNPIPGAMGQCLFTVDRTPPTLSLDAITSYTTLASVNASASDVLSGLDHVEMKLDAGSWSTVAQVSTTVLGEHTVYARAFDAAGNERDVRASFVVVPVNTTTRLFGPSSVKIKRSLKLTGTLSPAGPGRITIAMARLVGRKWKSAGTAKVGVVNGKFSYSFKPRYKGNWHFVASYSGGTVGLTTYKGSKSATKTVKVK